MLDGGVCFNTRQLRSSRTLTHLSRPAKSQNSALTRTRMRSFGCGLAFRQYPQFVFRNGKLRDATIHANENVWKYPDNGLINVL